MFFSLFYFALSIFVTVFWYFCQIFFMILYLLCTLIVNVIYYTLAIHWHHQNQQKKNDHNQTEQTRQTENRKSKLWTGWHRWITRWFAETAAKMRFVKLCIVGSMNYFLFLECSQLRSWRFRNFVQWLWSWLWKIEINFKFWTCFASFNADKSTLVMMLGKQGIKGKIF